MNCSLSRLLPRQIFLSLCIIAMVLTAIGCAVSDYRGYLNHATAAANGGDDDDDDGDSNGGIRRRSDVGESKLFGNEIAFITGDPETEGTYSITFTYDFRGRTTPIAPNDTYPSPIDIWTYRNRVVAAFNGDFFVDRDGDDIRCNTGDLSPNHDPADPAGQWERRYLYRDTLLGCQFAANFEKAVRQDCDGDSDDDSDDSDDNGDNGDDEVPDPTVLVCFDSPVEEVDNKDLSLQCRSNDPNPATPACPGAPDEDDGDDDDGGLAEAFASVGDMLSRIWNGTVGTQFTAEMTAIELDGVRYNLSNALTVNITRNSSRPGRFKINLTTEGGQSLVRHLINNTNEAKTYRVAGIFAGGMRVQVPAQLRFNQDSLWGLVND